MPAFTVERPCREEHQVGDVSLVRDSIQATHYAEHLEVGYEVLISGVLEIYTHPKRADGTFPRGDAGNLVRDSEFISPAHWVRVYDGPPRLDQ